MKILIAYDGSECSDLALVDLRYAGLDADAHAVVLTVDDAWLPPPGAAMQFAPAAAAPATTARLAPARACERLETSFPGWTLEKTVRAGVPASEILELADEIEPDLIVVGSHGLSAAGRLLIGSVSQRVVSHAKCSVRVGRLHVMTQATAPRIAIGLDEAPDARAAVDAVARRRWPSGTAAHLITVYDESLRHSHYVDDELSRIDQLQWMAAMQLREAGLECSRICVAGSPSQAIVGHAEAWGATSIFVGSRGLGPVKRLVLGSVASGVTTRAHCSVEVVRAPH
jgi:nucleotide-binding universal stress UspA family protein